MIQSESKTGIGLSNREIHSKHNHVSPNGVGPPFQRFALPFRPALWALHAKMKISPYPFTVSAALFGIVAPIAALLYSLIMGASLLRSDDPYIIGLVLATITSLALLIYLLLKELNIKWLNANYCIAAYYVVLSGYCLFIEYIGGEASGYGYFFLSAIALSSPAFMLVAYYPEVRKFINYGFVGGVLYLTGYIHALSNSM